MLFIYNKETGVSRYARNVLLQLEYAYYSIWNCYLTHVIQTWNLW